MRRFLGKSAAAALLTATSFAIPAPAAAAGVSVRTLAAQEARLTTMAYRMATANAHLCSRPEMMTGMILHDITQYQLAKRGEVSRAFALQSGFGVLQLVPGSAAARAGLRIDDEIVAVAGTSVEDPAALQSATSFHRMQAFADLLQSRLERGPTDLQIRRNGQLQRVTLNAARGCGGQLLLATSAGLSAWSDGRHIVLTTGMDAFAQSDDEIAFVIAHEMAHNILGHFGGTNRMSIFGVPRARNYELDADGFAVRLMGEAGYQPAAGIRFLERSRRRLWWAFSLDHPGFGSRIKTVAAEIGKWQQARPTYRQALDASDLRNGPKVTAAAVAAPASAPASASASASASISVFASASTLASVQAPTSEQAAFLPASATFAQAQKSWSQTVAWRMPGRISQP